MWLTNEVKEKINRIRELEGKGFNIPRFFYLKPNSPSKEIRKLANWAFKINSKNPKQIFNIRTYLRKRNKESSKTPHITDISFENLHHEVAEANHNLRYYCMIDAETPDDGRLAGNVVIFRPFNEATRFTIEFCEKPLRAMVRDHDQSMSGKHFNFPLDLTSKKFDKDHILRIVVNKAVFFIKEDPVILEWCWMANPAGIKQENLIFWEYRKF